MTATLFHAIIFAMTATTPHQTSLTPPTPNAIRQLQSGTIESEPREHEDSGSVDPVATVWAVAAFAFIMYAILAVSSFPFVRYRTGIPVLFLVLILLFPPSFFFLFVYLVLLRFGFMTTWWFVNVATTPQDVVIVDSSLAHASQAERRAIQRQAA